MLKLAAAAGGASLAIAPLQRTGRSGRSSPQLAPGHGRDRLANQGISSLNAAAGERLVALVDVDDSHLAKAQQFLAEQHSSVKWSGIKTFFDYRKMFDEMHKDIDAVFVATPDHHHALAAMIAMELGKHVYVEKPLAHTIDEVRQMTEAARKYKVVTQMGNQGHSGEGIRRLCEYIWAGAIGNVMETHSWAPTGRGGVGGRLPTKPVPAGLHWDEWIGPMPLTATTTTNCTRCSGEAGGTSATARWATGAATTWTARSWPLKLDSHRPASRRSSRRAASDERFPLLNVIRWDFPARGEQPPVKVYWYDGYCERSRPQAKDETTRQPIRIQNRPPIVAELEKKYGRDLKNGGTIYVGTRGSCTRATTRGSPRIIPEEKHRAFPCPPQDLPRIKGHAPGRLPARLQGRPTACSNFDYAGPLTEMVLLGCLAIKAGVGKKVEWDSRGPAMHQSARAERPGETRVPQGLGTLKADPGYYADSISCLDGEQD